MEESSELAVKDFLAERGGQDRSGDTKHRLPWIWLATSEQSGMQVNDGELPANIFAGLV